MKKLAALLAGIAFMAAGSAWATPTLTLTSGASTVTVTDQIAGDANVAVGAVTFIGSVGSWDVNVTSGFSPAGPGVPNMDLSSQDKVATGGNSSGDLVIDFHDIMTSAWTGNGADLAAGGTLAAGPGNSITFQTLINTLLKSTMTFGPTAFAGTDSFAFVSGPNDAIDMVVTIHQGNAGTSSFDYGMTPVPEPGTMMLLGAGFLGLAIYGKRRKNA